MKITYDYQSFCAGWLVSGLILSPAALAEIDRNMESRGAGWAETIIQAAASPGSILQRAGFIQQSRSLTLRHLTVRHGYAEGSGSVSRRGGGVGLDGGERELEHVAMAVRFAVLLAPYQQPMSTTSGTGPASLRCSAVMVEQSEISMAHWPSSTRCCAATKPVVVARSTASGAMSLSARPM